VSHRVFLGGIMKRLRAVDFDPTSSNQHELGGGRTFRRVLLEHDLLAPEEVSTTLEMVVLQLEDDVDPEPVFENVTLYGASRRDPTRDLEWRFYYPAGGLIEARLQSMMVGDVVAVLATVDRRCVMLLAADGSQWARLLNNRFAVNPGTQRVQPIDRAELERRQTGSPVALLASYLELSIPSESDLEWLEARLGALPTSKEDFPSTRTMAELGRLRSGIDPTDVPSDEAITVWLDTETRLFFALERYEGAHRLSDDRGLRFDEKVAEVLSILQRRRSRRGYSFEHHLEALFRARELPFETQVETEPSSISDFIFPGVAAYQEVAQGRRSPRTVLHLGAKSTSRERWKQLTTEAPALGERHVGTLDPRISVQTLLAMHEARVTPVMPATIRSDYEWPGILAVEEFVAKVQHAVERH
jgi:hypothetical protein